MLVEYPVGKTAQQPSPVVVVNDGVHIGCAADGFQTGLYAAEKFFSQTGSLRIIPSVSLRDVLLRFRRKDQLNDHNGFALWS
jgi:hypothetical protein